MEESSATTSSSMMMEGGDTRSSSSLVKKAYRLLYRNMRVEVLDGRVFVGRFHCFDKQGNIILYDAIEYRPISSSSSSSSGSSQAVEERSLGLILISSKVRKSCHVECSIDEQLSLVSLNSPSN